jgi:hypothetical protein
MPTAVKLQHPPLRHLVHYLDPPMGLNMAPKAISGDVFAV